MKKNFNLSLPQWMLDEIIGSTDNRSGRIQELIMKGYLYEKEKEMDKSFKKHPTSQTEVMRE